MLFNKIISIYFSNKKKNQHKISFFIYSKICFAYSFITSFIENLLLKESNKINIFSKKGIFRIKTSSNINKYLIRAKKKSFKILNLHNLEKENISKLINAIFDSDTRKAITSITGFKYSIDYFIIYENKHIEKAKLNQFSVYREPHFDKAFSRNMLKIFIPLNVKKCSGPLKVYHKGFKNLYSYSDTSQEKCTFILGEGTYLYGVCPNICWHHEGNPDKGYSAMQIMMQLNPSKTWRFRNDLFKRQFLPENKFPSFTSSIARTTNMI